MAMRETERSMRAYFLIVGAISALLALSDLGTASKLGKVLGALPASWMLALWFPILARLVLGVGYVAAGIKLRAALPLGAGWIKQLLLISIVVMITDAILIGAVMGTQYGQAGITSSLIGLVVTAYLLANLRRLADQAMANQPPPARVA